MKNSFSSILSDFLKTFFLRAFVLKTYKLKIVLIF